MTMRIQEFEARTASEAVLRAYHEFSNQMYAEAWPEDQAAPIENTLGWLLNAPPMLDVKRWLAWQGDQVIAAAELETWRAEDNQHLGFFEVNVLPACRRQGLGSQLLGLVAQEARLRNRVKLQAWVDGDSASGQAWLAKLGGKLGLETHTNQLNLAGVDRAMLRRWVERAEERAQGFVLETLVGPFLETSLEEMAQLFNVMNDAPRGDLDMEDEKTTPEHIREWDESMSRRSQERWHMHIRHVATGELAGYTETVWNPYRPDLLHQWGTGVWPKYRNLGLGRWLKAAMLEKVLRERPQVKRVRTGNADSNGPMLKINYELGFKPYKAWKTWQIEVEQVEQALNTQPELALA
ncbi:MAG: GNAT family N-acetyltransferase [Anaerolineae bacterium]|nr:GNAT family N-acetyltransferase [Anaerolineae bacterium]